MTAQPENMQVSSTGSQALPAVADLSIIGGAGHVGLPLGLVFADCGLRVQINDINDASLETIQGGTMPFDEVGAQPLLEKMLAEGRMSFTTDPSAIAEVPIVVVTIGTPVDEFLNPDTKVMKRWADASIPHLRDGQLVILRSTVYPGTTAWLDSYIREAGKKINLAYCPERIVQGFAVDELRKLPQIVSGTTPEAAQAAAKVFERIAPSVVTLEPLEAEFAKLFTNAYRYIQFAAANQFYMIANSAGVDYAKILRGLKEDYSRARDIPGAGYAAGPCLLKDTMQLAAFSQNQFTLGNSAMLVNEGLVLYVVKEMQNRYDLENMTVGLLGMAFKADCDDARSSLSYKLMKTLQFHAKDVLTNDPHVMGDDQLSPLDEVVERSDVLILCVPHSDYKNLDTGGKPVVDVWDFLGQGSII